MNILLYLEPHPIRESFTGHTWVGKLLCNMLEDEYLHKRHAAALCDDVRLLVSRHHTPVLQPSCARLGSAILGMTSEENDSLAMFAGGWDTPTIRIWEDLMRGTGAVSDFYRRVLERIRTQVFEFDAIVYWGTNGAVKRFAEENDIYSVAMELGCTRAPMIETVYFDPCGVNGDAITQYADVQQFEPASLELIQNIMRVTSDGKTFDAEFDPLPSRYANEIYENAGRNVLIPLQLDDDSNVLIHSDFKDMKSMLEEVVPKWTSHGYTCYVKPHPGSHLRRVPKEGHQRCREYCEKQPGVVWLDDIENHRSYSSLMRKMDVVTTLNSSVGFEAMIYGKPVVPLGRSCYNLPGVFPSVDDLLGNDFDAEKYELGVRRILNLISFFYLAPRYSAFDFNHFTNMVRRACRLADAHRSGDPEAVTRALLREPVNEIADFALRDKRIACRRRFSSVIEQRTQLVRQKLQRIRAAGKMLVQDPREFARKAAAKVSKLIPKVSLSAR